MGGKAKALPDGHPRMKECEAFALCNNEAKLTIEHPILGSYESCERCEVKLNGIKTEILAEEDF